MFTDSILDHFSNPRNAGELADADATVEISNPVCGDILKLMVRIRDDRVTEARFLCRGCTAAIACGSLLTEKLRKLSAVEIAAITAEVISQDLGDLPPATSHAAQLAADAARALAQKLGRQQPRFQ